MTDWTAPLRAALAARKVAHEARQVVAEAERVAKHAVCGPGRGLGAPNGARGTADIAETENDAQGEA